MMSERMFKMKTRIHDCVKCREQIRADYQYDVFANCVDSAACSALAMAIWALELEEKSEEEIKRFISDYFFIAETSEILGKKVRAEDAMKTYSEKYGVDFDKLSINIETKNHFMARYRRADKEDSEPTILNGQRLKGRDE